MSSKVLEGSEIFCSNMGFPSARQVKIGIVGDHYNLDTFHIDYFSDIIKSAIYDAYRISKTSICVVFDKDEAMQYFKTSREMMDNFEETIEFLQNHGYMVQKYVNLKLQIYWDFDNNLPSASTLILHQNIVSVASSYQDDEVSNFLEGKILHVLRSNIKAAMLNPEQCSFSISIADFLIPSSQINVNYAVRIFKAICKFIVPLGYSAQLIDNNNVLVKWDKT